MVSLGLRRRQTIDLAYQPGFSEMAWICLFILYAPLFVLVLFAFNDSKSLTQITGFGLHWFKQALDNTELKNSIWNSLRVAGVATVVSTIFATMAALATTRTRPYPGMALAYTVINQPLMVPEIVTAVATLMFFSLIKEITGVTGIGYLMLAHTVFCIPFAFMPIRARLEDMDLTLETAAQDLYATPFRAFRYVTLPLLVPGILGGAMLAFIVSFDDIIITMMVAGPGETTLPLYILGYLRRGFSPEINAVSAAILAVSVILVSAFFLVAVKRK